MAEKNMGKLMIVDDNEGVRHLVSRWLERAGFSVSQAKDGAEALDLIKKDPPTSSWPTSACPRSTGLELARMVKRDFPTPRWS